MINNLGALSFKLQINFGVLQIDTENSATRLETSISSFDISPIPNIKKQTGSRRAKQLTPSLLIACGIKANCFTRDLGPTGGMPSVRKGLFKVS